MRPTQEELEERNILKSKIFYLQMTINKLIYMKFKLTIYRTNSC